MRLPPDGAPWLIGLRWGACILVFITVWLVSTVLEVIVDPAPLYLIGCIMVGYNVAFKLAERNRIAGHSLGRSLVAQVLFDLLSLTLLLYFSDLPRNPFLFYYVFHMFIAGMYLRGWTPYLFAGLASTLVGAVMLLQYFGWIPVHALRLPADPPEGRRLDALYLTGVFVAFASTMWIAVYFSTSIRNYVDRTHAELRQKSKLLGIGQLVAGIAHEIANPLDGMQNCLKTIGKAVKDDDHLREYVQLMNEALERIERTAKRVQAFARPHGATQQVTDVNRAVEGTLHVLGNPREKHVSIRTELNDVPPVAGDLYTLQEVLLNLCTNALAAMPRGGTLTIRTLPLGEYHEDPSDRVGVEVSDTGVGIAEEDLEKIFEPFYTTRADTGGTGLGLGLSRVLILEMGGRLEVRSAQNDGTTFTVVLNRAQNGLVARQHADSGC